MLFVKGIIKISTSLLFEKIYHLYTIFIGSARAIVPTREMILECLVLAKPTAIISVPVLFNRVYDNVMKGVAEQSPLKQKIFKYAMSVARERNHRLEFGKPVSGWLNWKHGLIDKIVLSKIRGRLGGRLA